jgi:nitrogen fixation/metabolism regulation signal transduction histidine kinase
MAQAPRARLLDEIAHLRTQLAERDAQIESLRQSEARFRLMAESTNDLISLTTVTGEKLYASPSFQTSKPDGTGLGLAISRSIIESHGGRIWAETNSSGGAVFHFTLPVAQDDASLSDVANAEALR